MDNTSDRRRVFMRLSEKEKFETLFEMLTFQAANRVADVKLLAELRQDYEYMKQELDGINHRKIDTLDTSQKIKLELNKRSFAWIWYRDHMLAGTLTIVQTTIVLAILYFVFGGKLP
jgi:hypothetical protein